MRIASLLVLALVLTVTGCPGDSGKQPAPLPAPGGPGAGGASDGAATDGPPGPGPGGGPGVTGSEVGPAGAQGPAPGGGGGPVAGAALAAIDEPTLRGWLQGALAKPPDAFKPVEPAREALTGVLTESSGATSLFLHHDVDPHRGAQGGRWTAHAATGEGDLDLLRCEYRAGDLDVVLTEGANFLTVELRAPVSPRSLRGLFERFVRAKRPDGPPWKLDFSTKADLATGTHRLTNEGAPPVEEVASRDDRVDVLIADGRLFFVFYKKVEQLVGFAPDHAWFGDAARAKLR